MFYLHKISEDTGSSGTEFQFTLSPVADHPTENPVTVLDVDRDAALDFATKYIDQNYRDKSGYSLQLVW